MKHTTLLLTITLSALLFASCEKKGAPQAQPPAQADTPAPAEFAEPTASASHFYEGGRVRDTMYIDSQEGLRVRGEPSLSAEKRCAVPHRLPVKVVALGAEATIDGITAPWVEILIPRYEWQGEEAEYGWVFGGYLSEEQPKFIEPKNAEELADYLSTFMSWAFYDKYGDYIGFMHFYPDGTFSEIHPEPGDPGYKDSGYSDGLKWYGTWEALDSRTFFVSAEEQGTGESQTRAVTLEKIGDVWWSEANEGDSEASLFSYGTVEGYAYHEEATVWNGSILQTKGAYLRAYWGTLHLDYSKHPQESLIMEYIKAGIKMYDEKYHDYWNPIMAEHQRRAAAKQPAEEPAPAPPAAYGEKSRPTDALDIVFADGTATAWREGLTLTQAQKEAAVAVIFYRGTECSNDGRERLLGVGLAHEKDGLAWCTDDANAYHLNIDTIQCDASGAAEKLTFEGDLDGSDNLSQIGAYLAAHGSADDTADAQKYPAFHYAKNYAAQADSRVAGTPFADGWYLPTVAELFQIWKNREGVNAASELCGGQKFDTDTEQRFDTDTYVSSSQDASFDENAYWLDFFDGDWYYSWKWNGRYAVCAVRDFTERTDFSGGTPAPAQPQQGEQTARNVLY